LRWVRRRERGPTAACESAKRLATIAKEEESIVRRRGRERCEGEVKSLEERDGVEEGEESQEEWGRWKKKEANGDLVEIRI